MLLDALGLSSETVIGLTDRNFRSLNYKELLGVPVLGDDEAVFERGPENVVLVIGVAGAEDTKARKEIFEKFSSRGYGIKQVLHPSAVIARDCKLGEGVQVMAGAVIQTGTSIGDNTVINTHAAVDHDCTIGKHVHIAPGVTMSGGVRVSDGTHIGTGATIIQGVKIGTASLVAAGAVVVSDVPDGARVMGIPAREK